MTEPSPGLKVLYRDAGLLAVDKPSGLLVHRGWAKDERVAVDLAAELVGGRVWPLHRLDRGTSGVLLFARNAELARELSARFEAGEIKKRYLALVRGVVGPEDQLIDHGLRRHDPKTGKLRKKPKDGSEPERLDARTHVRGLGSAAVERYSLVEARPETGRTHQIRRHLKHISHPIIGDVRYGKGAHNRWFREQLGLHRLALHAYELRLRHPQGREDERELSIVAPLPAELASAAHELGIELGDLRCDELWSTARRPP